LKGIPIPTVSPDMKKSGKKLEGLSVDV
jgi:hypothetical protein